MTHDGAQVLILLGALLRRGHIDLLDRIGCAWCTMGSAGTSHLAIESRQAA